MKEWIWGRNPVFESLKANRRQFFELRIAQGVKEDQRLDQIITLAKKAELPITGVPKRDLDQISDHHQGIALQTSDYPYADMRDMLELARKKDEPLLMLILDALKDPQNLGTLIRSAEAVGVHGILLPLRRTATVTPAVVNASSGASEHSLIIQANLAQSLEGLKKNGAWVVGLDGGSESQPPDQVDLTGPLGVVVGSEGEGMRKLTRSSCDFLLRLPMRGEVDSLNAAVAGSIALYLVWQARNFQGARS
jgi:23S rRNA (guanosine2251-2'-O)-methyltransferase